VDTHRAQAAAADAAHSPSFARRRLGRRALLAPAGLDFLHHRELLGKLCQVAWHTAPELMAEATAEEDGFRTGMVAVVQSAGDLLEPNPHVHAIVPRGGWDAQGRWVPVPYVDSRAAELLFRHGVIAMLRDEGLLTQERIDLLMSWQANPGFSAHHAVSVEPEDPAEVERLARYLLRPPLSVERMRFDQEAQQVHYRRKRPSPLGMFTETLDPLEFLLRHLAAQQGSGGGRGPPDSAQPAPGQRIA
jgi:hypothetical protein